MSLKENIKRLRKDNGWTIKELARRTDMNPPHISRIETGKYQPSLETVEKLALAFEVTIDYLMHNTDGTAEEIRIENESMAERIKLLNTLSEKEQSTVIEVIDAMLTRKKLMDVLQGTPAS